MKAPVIVFVLFFICIHFALAQERVIYNFEGIAFNSKGKFVQNADLQLRIWIRNQKANGAIIYEEIQTVSTDKNGLFFVHIGNGKVLNGSMSMMGAESNSRFMKVEMASIGETANLGPVKFKCIKCRRSTDRYMPMRVEERGI